MVGARAGWVMLLDFACLLFALSPLLDGPGVLVGPRRLYIPSMLCSHCASVCVLGLLCYVVCSYCLL